MKDSAEKKDNKGASGESVQVSNTYTQQLCPDAAVPPHTHTHTHPSTYVYPASFYFTSRHSQPTWHPPTQRFGVEHPR